MSDRINPIAKARKRNFYLPGEDEGGVYMSGLSLGPMSKNVERAAERTMNDVKKYGVKIWAQEKYINGHIVYGNLVSPFIGAAPGQTLVTDHTSANLLKLMLAATAMRPDRDVILTD